jgi:IclR family pca regulon transcriptional regulator
MGRVLLASLSEADLASYFREAKLEAFTRQTVVEEIALRGILEKVARQGYCIVDQELEPDLRSLAIPVQNAAGRVAAAINVSAQASRTSRKQMLDEFLPVLRDAAHEMRPLMIG